MFVSQLYCELDSMNRRREARDEQPPSCMGKHLLKFPPHGPLAGRVTLALDIGRVLEQYEHPFFAILGERMQIEKPVVSGCGIDFEIAGVNEDPEWRMDGKRYAIDQAVGHLDGMDRERAHAKPLSCPDFTQVGVIEQLVLLQLV